MGCNWSGYCVVMPRTPDFSKAQAEMDRVREQVMALVPPLEWEDDDQAEAATAALEDLLVDPDFEHLERPTDWHHLLQRAQEALDSASKKWPPSYPDGDWRRVGARLVLFAGDMTWGDTPSGDGYALLRGLATFLPVARALEIE